MSLATTLLHVLCTAFAATFVVSFAEFTIHRHLMHRQRLPAWVYRVLPDLRAQFKNHAVLHHGTYYREFDHEPDPEGKTFNVRILWGDSLRLVITFLPVMAALWFLVSWLSALTFLTMLVGHNLLWGVVHMQMHVPAADSWVGRTAYFRFISRHHFMHHQQTGKNYNVVVPLADFVIGRVARRKVSDVREMLRLGYLVPRHAASVARVQQLREDKLAARAALAELAALAALTALTAHAADMDDALLAAE